MALTRPAAAMCSPCLCQARARALHLRRCAILNSLSGMEFPKGFPSVWGFLWLEVWAWWFGPDGHRLSWPGHNLPDGSQPCSTAS